ncbi:MAG: lysylphosphatidylglycerol synthase transmembrane domain-containing protein [Proteobacteria bacterium]|nr:lysylphosphatidylglycerol synthase transmembrane domain-containing protein [Pseudomonadota bacterium]
MLRFKTIGITILKVALATGLIAWLIESGKVDFYQLNRFIKEPELLLAAIAYWMASCFLGTWRWISLLEGAGFRIFWRRTLQLQVTGFFFNTVMPGAVGGDIIKLAYIIRDNKDKSKTLAMMTVLLDRIVGLSGLFMIGWIFMLSNLSEMLGQPRLIPLVLLMGGISLGFILFYTAALYHYKGSDPVLRLLSLPIPGLSLVLKLYNSLRAYRYARLAIFRSILLSLVIQAMSLLLFYLFTCRILGLAPPFGSIASIFPVGVLTTAIPITPGGLGVGHVAFDRLFTMINLNHGATVFNLFIISQLILNLLGVIPYLSLRRSQPIALDSPELEASSMISKH